jgi:hypothetical protein
MRNWIYGEKILAYCTSDYRIEIRDRKDKSINFSSMLQDDHKSITRNINDMGDNIGNKIAIRDYQVYFITQKKELRKIIVKPDTIESTLDAEFIIENIADVATGGKKVYMVSLDGLISNLEHKHINVKLPCQEDEKFTHMKYGCGMLIAISFRNYQSSSFNKYHIVRIDAKSHKLVIIGSEEIESPGSLA